MDRNVFIKHGDIRINFSVVKNYKKHTLKHMSGENHSIKLKYLDDKEEYLKFFRDEKERDVFLQKIDKLLLIG